MSVVPNCCSCKVGRVLEQYELTGLHDEIVRRREKEDESLRGLEEFVNTRILRRAIEQHAERDPLVEAGSIYQQLTNGEDAGERAEIRERLSRAGVPTDEITGDFVSHQTVRSHLNSCLGIDTERSRAMDIESVENLAEWARTRNEEIIERALSRLHESGELDIGEPNVIHSVRVLCEECGQSLRLQDLLDTQECRCSDTATTTRDA